MPGVLLLFSKIGQGLVTAGMGLAGVFAVLIVFYICTKIMLKISINSNKKAAAKAEAEAAAKAQS